MVESGAGARIDGFLPHFLIGGGVLAAAQLGKAIVAMPLLQSEMSLSISTAAFVIATFATLAATVGLWISLLARDIGPRKSLVMGMILMAIGSTIGAGSNTTTLFIISRIVEGFGFLAVIVVTPGLLNTVAHGKNRQFYMASWGAFLPVGTVLMLIMGPFLGIIGWRSLWLLQSGLLLSFAIAALFLIPADATASSGARKSLLSVASGLLRNRSALLLGISFGIYAFQYHVLAGFLPLILVGGLGLTLTTASLLTAGAVGANAVGSIAAGLLLRAGVPVWTNVAVAFGALAIAPPFTYSLGLEPQWVALVASLALGFAGLAPGSIWAAVPQTITADLITPTSGLIQQSSNVGQFAGPVIVGLLVQQFGWAAAPAVLVPVALLGIGAALWLRADIATRRQEALGTIARE